MTDKQLIEAYLAKREPFTRLHQRIDPIINSALSPLPWPRLRIEREDGAQLVWQRLLAREGRLLGMYDPRRAQLETYISMITRSTYRDLAKSRLAPAPVDPAMLDERPGEEEDVGERVIAAELLEKLQSHLKKVLSPRCYLVLMLHFVDGQSAEGIAKQLGVRKNSVYKHIHQIRQVARVYLNEDNEP